jgi:osmotically-inducible protein OsmY
VRGQESAGAYVDDSAITTEVKAKFVADKQVDAGAINVQTLHGEVALSGFAKSAAERARAEEIARAVKGVRTVRNNLVVR